MEKKHEITILYLGLTENGVQYTVYCPKCQFQLGMRIKYSIIWDFRVPSLWINTHGGSNPSQLVGEIPSGSTRLQ